MTKVLAQLQLDATPGEHVFPARTITAFHSVLPTLVDGKIAMFVSALADTTETSRPYFVVLNGHGVPDDFDYVGSAMGPNRDMRHVFVRR